MTPSMFRVILLLGLLGTLPAILDAQTPQRFGGDDRSSGFQTDEAQAVTVYSETRFRGRSERFTGSDRRLDDNRIGNDGPVSARIPRGCSLTLFEHFDFIGRSIRLEADVADLDGTRFGAREASSLRVECDGRSTDDGSDDDGWHNDRDGDDGAAEASRHLGDRRGALLFSDTTFRGRHHYVHRSFADLSPLRVGDDSVSSVRVAAGCTLTLFTEPGFRGASTTLHGDQATLRGTAVGPDTASSLHVDCGKGRDQAPTVTVYADSRYRGMHQRFDDDVADLGATRLGDDRVGSLRIDDGCRVVLFAERDFRGRTLRLDKDTASLVETPVGPDNASSLRVECRRPAGDVQIERLDRGAGALLFDRSRFEGDRTLVRGDVSRLSATSLGNDRASSIRVAPGCEAWLFSDADFRGRSFRTTESIDDLDRTPVGSNALSSIRVRCR